MNSSLLYNTKYIKLLTLAHFCVVLCSKNLISEKFHFQFYGLIIGDYVHLCLGVELFSTLKNWKNLWMTEISPKKKLSRTAVIKGKIDSL